MDINEFKNYVMSQLHGGYRRLNISIETGQHILCVISDLERQLKCYKNWLAEKNTERDELVDRLADVTDELSDLRKKLAAMESQEASCWNEGVPRDHWAREWFIARLDTGERVVLTALPEEYSYDFKTADETYYKAHRVKSWMQFPDSNYIHQPADKPAVAVPEPIIEALRQAVMVVAYRSGDVDTEDGSYATTDTDCMIRLESALCEALGTKYDDIDLDEALELLGRLSTESVSQALICAGFARDALHYKNKFEELLSASPAPSHSQQSAKRITEQDAIEIIEDYKHWQQFDSFRDSSAEQWCKEDSGKNLLKKLNKDRCPSHESEQDNQQTEGRGVDMAECTYKENQPNSCPYCANERCAKCFDDDCDHDVTERHEEPEWIEVPSFLRRGND